MQARTLLKLSIAVAVATIITKSLAWWVTGSVGLLSDAQVLARLVNGVIFVIAAGSTPAGAVQRAVSELGADSIIGTVLNRVDDRHIPEANYYGEYYGYDDGH